MVGKWLPDLLAWPCGLLDRPARSWAGRGCSSDGTWAAARWLAESGVGVGRSRRARATAATRRRRSGVERLQKMEGGAVSPEVLDGAAMEGGSGWLLALSAGVARGRRPAHRE
jgi:hypothetical protein